MKIELTTMPDEVLQLIMDTENRCREWHPVHGRLLKAAENETLRRIRADYGIELAPGVLDLVGLDGTSTLLECYFMRWHFWNETRKKQGEGNLPEATAAQFYNVLIAGLQADAALASQTN